MDDFLDAMYGTRENIGGPDISELEKNAEAELLFDALKEEGYNTDQIDAMSGDDVLKVAQVLFGEDSAIVKAAVEGEKCEKCKHAKGECKCPKEEPAKEASARPVAPTAAAETFEEKVAHADQLGRIMAHSFVDEVSNIEKQAQYEQIKEAKAQQVAATLGQLNQTPAEKIAAKIAGQQTPAAQPQIDEAKFAAAYALMKEAGVDPFAAA
jgi:hypothetical protein